MPFALIAVALLLTTATFCVVYDDSLKRDRYMAVNLTNLGKGSKDTIEIRICKGTLNTETMLADADFFLHIVRNAKKISWKNIDNIKLWLKGLRPATIEHMNSRNAFVGALA